MYLTPLHALPFSLISSKDATMVQGPGSSQRMFADICKDICRFWTKGLCSTPGPTWGTSGTWWTSPWCHAPSPLSITPWRKLHICNSSQKEYLQWDSLETFIFLTKAVTLLYFWSIFISLNQKSFNLTLLIDIYHVSCHTSTKEGSQAYEGRLKSSWLLFASDRLM